MRTRPLFFLRGTGHNHSKKKRAIKEIYLQPSSKNLLRKISRGFPELRIHQMFGTSTNSELKINKVFPEFPQFLSYQERYGNFRISSKLLASFNKSINSSTSPADVQKSLFLFIALRILSFTSSIEVL